MFRLSVRAAQTPDDYPAIAELLENESPGWGASAEELAYEEAHRSPEEYHAILVAEVTDLASPLMVGVAFIGEDPLAQRAGKYTINLRVRTDWQGRGVGKALYQAVLEHLAPFAPEELWAFVWQAHPRTGRFLTERGFVEAWQRVDWVLEVANFDFAPYAGLEERLREQGITITTYAQLAADPDRLQKLYELDWALWQSIPYGQSVTRRSLQQFAAAEVDHPKFIADACFVATKDGQFLGYSNLSPLDDGFNTEMTGVLPAHRGQGIATLLKLRGIRYTQAHGNGRLSTQNDSVNSAMIALNQKLGFVQEGANVRFVKQISKP
jgi:GNAT superfamily N-acetyltransferase